jgi:hypothetical protein
MWFWGLSLTLFQGWVLGLFSMLKGLKRRYGQGDLHLGWSASIARVDPSHEARLKSPSLQKPKTGAPEIPSQRPGHPPII